ncbi:MULTISPECIES: branched-chain amino acid ABC transporter permease [unclassified Limnohabitans]|jgi:branched-chain amino acid transport system permease protein|uniref:branched-chain amino acid ABC transporter permease n=1 Tax=unclassified Limnohabitans TaxID=2626134 RepID=UPI000D372BD4|nr:MULTISPECIES: branched-chain amino acid ABC transporter permease [unclassified Limnohabitans]PUE18936.1 branched-chain amino acid ABC transporter permease [Limnohabitans sp. MMS-10A-192]PUE24458.1 branched-chain amino acid ABC transporter permease [Limnohabitans sp. MMS-10A-160]
MPSAGLLLQALASGVFLGALYGLIGLGIGLGWGLLRQINLAHFAWVFLSAYITYELKTRLGVDPLLSLLVLVPLFAALGMALQSVFARFAITPFNSLLVTFGITVSVEALLQWIWSADFRRMSSVYDEHKFRLGTVVVTYSEALTLGMSLAAVALVWWMLHRTDMGKSVRASAEDPAIATAFGINAKRLAVLLAGLCAALAACAGVCVALTFTLAPSQIFAWVGVVFAVVMIGRLGSALTPLVGGLVIGISEAMTQALIAPTWAPLVAFTVLILILLLRRGDE